MDYEIEVRRLSPQPTLMVRGRAALADVPATIGEHLEAVSRRIEELGEEPAGPPYARYHEVGEEEVELEAGFPVSRALEGAGPVEPSELPGGEAAATEHWGSYDDLPAAAAALGAWVARHGRKAAGARWEVYWTDPREVDDLSEVGTEVLMPLRPEGRG